MSYKIFRNNVIQLLLMQNLSTETVVFYFSAEVSSILPLRVLSSPQIGFNEKPC